MILTLPIFVALLSVTVNLVLIWALVSRPRVVRRVPVDRVPEHLARLAAVLGIKEDLPESQSYGRYIHDFIEELKAEHAEEIRRLEEAQTTTHEEKAGIQAELATALKCWESWKEQLEALYAPPKADAGSWVLTQTYEGPLHYPYHNSDGGNGDTVYRYTP